MTRDPHAFATHMDVLQQYEKQRWHYQAIKDRERRTLREDSDYAWWLYRSGSA